MHRAQSVSRGPNTGVLLLLLLIILVVAAGLLLNSSNSKLYTFSSSSNPEERLTELERKIDEVAERSDVYLTNKMDRLVELEAFLDRITHPTEELLDKLEGLYEEVIGDSVDSSEEMHDRLKEIEKENPEHFRPKTEDDIA